MRENINFEPRMVITFFDRHISHDPIKKIPDVTSINIIDELPANFDAIKVTQMYPVVCFPDENGKDLFMEETCFTFTTKRNDIPSNESYNNPYPFLNGQVCETNEGQFIMLCPSEEEVAMHAVAMVTRYQEIYSKEARQR